MIKINLYKCEVTAHFEVFVKKGSLPFQKVIKC